MRKLIKKFFDESVQDDLLAIVPLCEDDVEADADAAVPEITFFKLDDGGDGKITAHIFFTIKDAGRDGSDFTKGWRLPAHIDKGEHFSFKLLSLVVVIFLSHRCFTVFLSSSIFFVRM